MLLYQLIVGTPPYKKNDSDINDGNIFQNIQISQVKIPEDMSNITGEFILALLEKDPTKRLGSGPSDANKLKRHPFFDGIDWNKVLKGELKMPVL